MEKKLADDAPPKVPDHELFRCIGRGSYGSVWLARSALGAYRAVKVVRRAWFEEDRPYQREFEGIRQFEPLSRTYEGFVDILQVGQNNEEGYFYCVMELGDDETRGQAIDPEAYSARTLQSALTAEGRLPLADCLQLGLSLSRALGELHKHGLIHRDVKPSNIIFVNGIPKLADMGLVTHLDTANSYVGTEGFIPPEGPTSAQADVYSLGKVLYEASTGKDRTAFPELPMEVYDSKASDALGLRELNEVVLHACQNDRSARYPSAREMHAELTLVENGQSVKRLRVLERRLRWLKRAAAMAGVVVLAGGLVYFQLNSIWRRQAEDRARTVATHLGDAAYAMDRGDLLGALGASVEALNADVGRPESERTHRLRIGSLLERTPKLVRMWQADAVLRDCQLSPDGKKVAVALGSAVCRIWDIETGEPAFPEWKLERSVDAIAFSPDGNRLVLALDWGWQTLCRDVATGEECFRLDAGGESGEPSQLECVAFSGSGDYLVTAHLDGSVRIWSGESGTLVRQLKCHAGRVRCASFSPDGRYVATASTDRTAAVWDWRTGRLVAGPFEHAEWVYQAVFRADGTELMTASFDRTVRMWNLATGKEIRPAMRHLDGVQGAEFSQDGRFVVSAGLDSFARLWDAYSHQPVENNPSFRFPSKVKKAFLDPSGRRLVTSTLDGIICVWDLANSVAVLPPVDAVFSENGLFSVQPAAGGGGVEVCSVGPGAASRREFAVGGNFEEGQVSEDGRFLVSLVKGEGDAENRVRVWDTASGEPMSPPLAAVGSLGSVALSRSGRYLSFHSETNAWLYDLRAGELPFPVISHEAPIQQVEFNPAGDLWVVASGPKVFFRDCASGRSVVEPIFSESSTHTLAFSGDGRRLIVSPVKRNRMGRSSAMLLKMPDCRLVALLEHEDDVLQACFSPDNRLVMTVSEDFSVSVWDAATGRRHAGPLRHLSQVLWGRFSPDGRWIVAVCRDQTLRIWDSRTGDAVSPFVRLPGFVDRVQFIGNGDAVVARYSKGSGWRWDLPVEGKPAVDLTRLADLLCGGFSRLPSPSERYDAWVGLKREYPSEFEVGASEAAEWHRRQARLSAGERLWDACVFHAEWGLRYRAGDEALESLRNKALLALKKKPGEKGSR